ncbi:MAG: hypothetical protein FWE37_05300 [Spirochaetaceae bacterium]|nr:hypothetical protein [Spirochaetaceae bacterium]
MAINSKSLLDVIVNENYNNQVFFIFSKDSHVYAAPAIIEGNGRYFLKTISPSRKYKKIYIKE